MMPELAALLRGHELASHCVHGDTIGVAVEGDEQARNVELAQLAGLSER